MNTVSTPSLGRATSMKLGASPVKSTKPVPGVCTVRIEETMLLALTVEGAVRVEAIGSNLPRDVLLHAVGHVDQLAPGTLQKRHHAVDVLIAGQRNLDL